MESIIQSEKECFVCKTTQNLESHHIFGASNRKHSERYGLKIWLCHSHHNEPPYGIHFDKAFRQAVQGYAQSVFEAYYPKHDFIKIFGRNYK